MTDAARSARVMRTFARVVTALVAGEGIICLYLLLFGGIRLDAGPLRISAGTWRHPLTQAIVLTLLAAWLYWRDAVRQGEWDVVPRLVRRLASRVVATIGAEPLLWTGVVVATMAAAMVCDLVAAKAFVIGSAEGGWTYPYVREIPTHTVAVVLIVGASIAAAVRWLTAPRGARGDWAVAIAWIAIATGCQAFLRSLAPFGFEQILLSDGANSFYTVTQQYGAESVLSRFAELRGSWPMHAHSNMPGKLLLLYALELVSNDATVLSWLLLAVSNLGGLLLYLLVRDLFGDRQIALYALVLYLFVPAKLFFLPLMNTVTPVVAIACLLLFERWLQRASLGYGIAAAVSLYTLAFFEPMPLVIGGLVALILARALMRGDIALKTLMTQSLFMIAAFFGTIALVWLLFDFNLVEAFRRVASDAAAFNADEDRPYGLWVRRNLVDFGFGVGICQLVLFWFAVADGLTWRAGSLLNRPIVLFSAALIGMLLALDLAGVNRGEVIRLWIFLACLFQVPAAYVCIRLRNRAAFAIVLMLTIVQSALATATIGFVVP
jgi:hypothetical protein